MTKAANASRPESVVITSLRKRSDFDRVFREGRRRRAGALVVVEAPGDQGLIRLGLVVGRRVGTAVDRNRVKRRLRHALAESCRPGGTDLVVIASPGVSRASYADLRQWLGDDGREKEEAIGG